jgi:peptide/nickel transport system substrate-binding protein
MTVDLRPAAKFSNGDFVTAEDIKFSYDLLKTPALQLLCYCNPYASYIDSLDVLDNDTIRFNFEYPVSYLLSSCVDNIFKLLSFGIVKKSIVEPLISSYGYGIFDEVPFTGNISDELLISCGPYKISNYELNFYVELVPNEYWYGEGPYLDKLSFKYLAGKDNAVAGLMEGRNDMMDKGYYPVQQDFNPQGVEPFFSGAFNSEEMIINLKHPIIGTGELTPKGTPMAALNIRRAISHIIPRDTFVEEVFDGLAYPGVTPMPRDCVGFDSELEPYEYNITLAKMFMEKAGFEFPEETPTETTGTLSLIILSAISLVVIQLVIRKKRIRK